MTTPMESPKLLWTVEELAAATSLSRSFIYQQISAGRIETVHIGRACRITQSGVDSFIESLGETSGGSSERHAVSPPPTTHTPRTRLRGGDAVDARTESRDASD